MVSQRRLHQQPDRALTRGARAAALACLWALPCVAEETPPTGFTYCAPPLRPACIDDVKMTGACETDVQAFIKTVFKYRTCLEKESERAVREANEVLEIAKCRTGVLKCR